MRLDKIGVVGAGTMGRGLAEAIASQGMDVLLNDRDPDQLNAAREAIEISLQKRQEKWAITEAEKRIILGRISYVDSLAPMAQADLVIETIIEDLEQKKEVFAALDRICKPDAILATNTSTLSITELAAVTQRPAQVLGLHFMNPVPTSRLVEVVRGLKTSEKTVAIAADLVAAMGKEWVEVYETPGFVSTRLVLTLCNEAMYALMEGVATAEGIDKAMRLGYGMPRGPLETADRMGLDTILLAMERLFREYGDSKFRPCPLLRKLVRAGHLGAKTGQGFFRYNRDGERIPDSHTSQGQEEGMQR